MNKKFDLKKEGILFWITGLQGSGKTTISKKLKNKIEQLYGKTLFCDGDILRNIFDCPFLFLNNTGVKILFLIAV